MLIGCGRNDSGARVTNTGVKYGNYCTLWWRSQAARRFRWQRRRRHRKRSDDYGGGVCDLTGRPTVCTRRARTHRTRRSRWTMMRVRRRRRRRRHASNARGQWSSWPAVDARRRRPAHGSPALGPHPARPRQYPRCAPPPRWRRPTPSPPSLPSRRPRRPSLTRQPPLPWCCRYCWRPRATPRRLDSSRASITARTQTYVPGRITYFLFFL